MGSKRLRGKALALIEGQPILRLVLRALSNVQVDVRAVVCDPESQSQFENVVRSEGYLLFTGHPTDVLQRFCDAAEAFGVDTLIRATGDNPLVSAKMAQEILTRHRDSRNDYSRFEGLPLGTGVEVVGSDCLNIALCESVSEYDHEHVTPFVYDHPDRFAVEIVPAPAEYSIDARVTVDTAADLERMRAIFAPLYSNEPIEIDILTRYLKRSGGTDG